MESPVEKLKNILASQKKAVESLSDDEVKKAFRKIMMEKNIIPRGIVTDKYKKERKRKNRQVIKSKRRNRK